MALIGISGKIGSGKDTVGNIINHLVSVHSAAKYNNTIDYSCVTGAFEIKKFADELKNTVCRWIGCTREQLEDREFKEAPLPRESGWWTYKSIVTGKVIPWQDVPDPENWIVQKTTPRLLLQLLGTECGREIIHPNIWINTLMSGYIKSGNNIRHPKGGHTIGTLAKYPNWIITDVRFPNELKAVKDRDGISIRINRHLFNTKVANKNLHITHEDYAKTRKEPQHPSETALDNAKFDYVIDNNGTIEELVEKVKQILIKVNIT